jgi:phosphatidylglycerophosphate synthase
VRRNALEAPQLDLASEWLDHPAFCGGRNASWVSADWQFMVSLVAGFSDLIDGWLSRWLRPTSHFGQIADPIADKRWCWPASRGHCEQNGSPGPDRWVLVARDLALEIVGSHGGTVTVVSSQESGTSFTMRLLANM